MREIEPVVLTGIGAITSRGDYTLNGEFQPRESGAFSLENFALENYLASAKTYLDRASALALAGGALALRDAGMSEWPFNEEQFGITLGTHNGCLETMEKFWAAATEKGVRLANPLLFSHSYFNSPISLCAIEFGLKGYHATFCAHQNSALEAVRAAYGAIALGHAEAMLCGGVEAITPTRSACENRDNLGEAAVFFVLESREHATRRGIATDVQTFDESSFSNIFPRAEIDANFGDCGGVASVLSLARELLKI